MAVRIADAMHSLSSKIIVRTHKHRLTNKRELLVWSNHWRRAPLVRY